ncbi:MAG: riboflavin synthase [Lachnospiraceae bacterium]|nr:riboflavin synthase [Lachnospiraceae bacterium]
MFTGIIEEIGTILEIKRNVRSCTLTIGCKEILADVKVGDSIAVNGICFTAVRLTSAGFTADVMAETVNRTNLSGLKAGAKVNLERAMAANGRFGGHIVSGHIDGTGQVTGIREDENAVWYTIRADRKILRYIIEKGSVALNGVSLTVAAVSDTDFRVSLIPHTREITTFENMKIGSVINIENDLIGKYVEKFLMNPGTDTEPGLGISGNTNGGTNGGTSSRAGAGTGSESGVTAEFLARCGF